MFVTLKHFTGHGQPESGTNVGPAHVGERELRDDFFPPFESAVKTYPVRSVMASYNEIDGIPSHANGWLLNDVLRGEWGYQGAVVSDYYAIRELMTRHKMFGDIKDAAERAIKSGVDVETPDPEGYVLPAGAGARGPRAAGAGRRGGAARARAEVRGRPVRESLSGRRDRGSEDRHARRDRARPRGRGQGHRAAQERQAVCSRSTRRRSAAWR